MIGALALAAYGYTRATRDVDLMARIPLPEVVKRLKASGVKCALRHGDKFEGDFSLVRGVIGGVNFDVLPPIGHIEWDRTATVPMGDGEELKVVDLGTLIDLKFRAGGPQDVLDVVMLVLRSPEKLEFARELAASYQMADQFESFLDNPRVRAKAPKRVRL
ncbi:MAG: hypothetical protein HY049_13750 [Acidobacteria bacterium]|nr:hypothetical protein [Acidobacteriota bacterium]